MTMLMMISQIQSTDTRKPVTICPKCKSKSEFKSRHPSIKKQKGSWPSAVQVSL